MAFQNTFKQYLASNSQSENEKLTENEMKDLQEAIDNSKKACQSGQKRSESDCSVDILEGSFTESGNNRQQLSGDNSNLTKRDFKMTFQDLPETRNESLDVLYHPPVFDLPLNLDKDFKKYSVEIRTKLLFDYFTKLDHLQAEHARTSLKLAPYPKPILPSNKFKLASNDKPNEEITHQTPKNFYVSRAGRHIKRKIYTEDDVDSDSDLSSHKKNKLDDSDLKITLETPLFSETEKANKNTRIKKEDSPWRPTSAKKYTSRSEEMFEKMKQEEEKRKQQEEEMDAFVKSLNDDFEDEKEEEFFEKIRVVPTIPGKKRRPKETAKTESVSVRNEKKSTNVESPPSSPPIRRFANRGRPPLSSKTSTKNPKKEEATTSKLQKIACPICNKNFLQSEIENHASNCGTFDEIIDDSPIRSSTKTLTCELCEKKFGMNSDYEVHVKQCIAAHVTDI